MKYQFYLLLLSSVFISHTSFAQTSKEGLGALSTKITQAEQQYDDIVEGANKFIRWYQDKPEKTNLSIVYIHGFSASRQELSPVTERLADQLAANVFYTRLTGHGRSDDAMAEASIQAWQSDMIEAYDIGRLIGNKVIFISTSTGGTLVTWLLSQDSIEQPFANIMISPNYAVQSKTAWLMKSSWGLKFAKLVNGDYNSFEPLSDAHGKFWTERYPLEAVGPMMHLLDQVEELDKSKITTHQLIIYSPNDKVIKPNKVISVSKEFKNSKTQLIAYQQSTDPYQHVLAGIACSPESTDDMINLLSNYISELLTE